jgi:hypothetical protein
MLKKLACFCMTVAALWSISATAASADETLLPSTTYNLLPSQWNIYTDGTHPVETTNGLNNALQWAHDQGYTVFKVPAGTYEITKGTNSNDPEAQINMVSNMTFWLDDNAIIQKEKNSWSGYRTMYVGYGVNNVKLQGGTYQGDRLTHDFSSGGTQEGGIGIFAEGAYNLTIDGVKTFNFTGDGIMLAGSSLGIGGYPGSSYIQGDIDNNGSFISSTTKLRSKAPLDLSVPRNAGRQYISFEQPQGVTDNHYDIYFYNADGTFLSAAKHMKFGTDLVPIPSNADHMYPVFNASSTTGFFVKLFSNDVSRNVVVKNSESAYNRRQGITLGGVDGVEITANRIHDIKGTAPQFGIDAEAEGFFPNNNLNINNNHFYNNTGGDIVLADGDTALINQNIFESNTGLYTWAAFVNSTISNNTFYNSGLTMGGTGTANGNTLFHSQVYLSATSNTFTNAFLSDSSLNLNSSTPFGSNVANVTITNTDTSVTTSLNVGSNPVRLSNMTIKGMTKLSTLGGKGNDQNVYDNLVVQDYNAYNGTGFPAGTYNNCKTSSTLAESGGLGMNQAGKYVFNNCSFQAAGKLFTITNTYGMPDVSFNNSRFSLTQDVGYAAAIYVQGAKQVSFRNSSFTAMNLTRNNTPYIKIGSIGGGTKPTQVLSATLQNNTISTNKPLIGIDTTDAGIGAPPYTITNNILHVAVLHVRATDIASGNQQLPQ